MRFNIPRIDMSASEDKIAQDIEYKKSGAWRVDVSKKHDQTIKKVYRESFFGARNDLNPFRDEKAREMAMTASAKRRLRKQKREEAGKERLEEERENVSLVKERLIRKVESEIQRHGEEMDQDEGGKMKELDQRLEAILVEKDDDDVFVAPTQLPGDVSEEVIHEKAENEVDAASDADNGEGGDLYN